MSSTYVEGLGGIDIALNKIVKSADFQVAALDRIASILARKLATEAELNQSEVDRRLDVWRKEIARKILDYIRTEAPSFDAFSLRMLAFDKVGKPPAVVVAEQILKIINEVKP